MTKTIRQPVLLLVSTNSELIEATQQALAGTELLHLAEEQVSSRILSKAIVNTQPDVVLLDFENLKQPYFLVYKLAAEYPMFPSIAILPESKLEIADRVVQAGARRGVQGQLAAAELRDGDRRARGVLRGSRRYVARKVQRRAAVEGHGAEKELLDAVRLAREPRAVRQAQRAEMEVGVAVDDPRVGRHVHVVVRVDRVAQAAGRCPTTRHSSTRRNRTRRPPNLALRRPPPSPPPRRSTALA